MSVTGYSGYGTLLQVGDSGTPTEAFVTLANVGDISGPEFTADQEETTSHSTPGAYKSYITTLKDGGDVSFDLFFIGDATQQALVDIFESRAINNFRIILPFVGANNTLTFAGNVTSLGLMAPVQGVLTRSVTIKVSGQATYSTT